MNQMALHFRLYLKNWQLLLFAFFPGLALTAPALFAHHRTGDPHLMLTLLGTAGVVCGAAFFLGTAQQEFLSRSFTFLLPDLRAGMVRQILVVLGLVFAGVVATVFLNSAYVVEGHALPALAWSTACLMATAFSLLLLLLYSTPLSSWLPFQAFWLAFLLIKFFVNISPTDVGAFLDHPGIWTLSAVLSIFAALRRMGGASLHRRLVEQPFISIVDLKNAQKMEDFKHARRRHKNTLEKETRPGSALIRQCLERAALASARADHAGRLLWQAAGAMFMISIPRRRLWHAGLVLMILTFIVWLGYWDAYIGRDPDDDGLVGWFPGLVFMAVYFSLPCFHFIKTRPLGLLHSRQAMFRAGLQSVALTLAQTMALAGILYAVFFVGSLVLPVIEWRGCELQYQLPAWHTPLLPLFFLPFQLLVHTLWRMKGSMQVLNQAGTFGFFGFHAALTFSKGGLILWAAAVAAMLWIAFLLVWRWRMFRSDLA
jgi:hypothetical protein